MKVAFYTLGCKVNQYETDLLKEKFEQSGYDIVRDNEHADIYCINTCTVTNMSDRKTRQAISRMRKQNRDSIIAILGCYAESIKENIDIVKGVDVVLGNEDKHNAFEIIHGIACKNKKNSYIKISDIDSIKQYTNQGSLKHGYEIRESIKIEDGCNNFCSYCIIPYVRGRVRSRNIEEIVEEVRSLSYFGVKEIVLVGIEVASYGMDRGDIDLVDVVQKVAEVEGIERVRLSSIEPRFLTKDNLYRLKAIEKFCPHFHISMQSGSSETLKRMNRKYGKELLIEVCKNIYSLFEKANITADVIVGFPGETDSEFNETCETIKEMKLSTLHVFKYSKRKYTRAASMESQIDGNIKKNRSGILLDLSEKLRKKYEGNYVGKKERILIEAYNNGYVTGYTENYLMIKARGDKHLCGTIQDVVLISSEKGQMIGNIEE